MSAGGLNDPELPELLQRALEQRDQGLDPDLERLCEARPDMLEPLRALLEKSVRLPHLQRASLDHDWLEGSLLDERFQLERRVGSGAMGVVYRARDLQLQRTVAIKILRSELLGSVDSLELFQREARVLAAIRHSAVVTIFDCSRETVRDPYLVIEFLEGTTFAHLIEHLQQCFGETAPQDMGWIAALLNGYEIGESSYLRTLVRWCADLASGLHVAHSQGIFHRDVKPSNIFLRQNAQPVLIDFGIASYVNVGTLGSKGWPLGTPTYMAPESLRSNARPDARVDIYGLAATLYHLVTLRAPYVGHSSGALAALASEDPPPVGKLAPSLPKDLQAIIECGLARDPRDRYATAEQFEADLRAFLDHRPVQARRLSAWTRGWRRARRSRALTGGLSVVLLFSAIAALVAGRGWAESRRRERFSESWQRLPASLSWVPEARRRSLPSQRPEEVLHWLDAAVEARGSAVQPLLVRATFHRDQGRGADAMADIRRLARELGTSYGTALLETYASSDLEAGGALPLVDTERVALETREDLYVHAYHVARERGHDEALPWLLDERCDGYLPAEELRLYSSELQGMPTRFYDEVIEFEQALGYRTAATAKLAGAAMLIQRRYARAAEILREGLQLSPLSYGLHFSLGTALYRLGHFEESVEAYGRALEIRPDWSLVYYWRTLPLLASERTREAEDLLLSAPLDGSAEAEGIRAKALGHVEVERALEHLSQDEFEAAKGAAGRALDFYREAVERGERSLSSRLPIAEALHAGQLEPFFASFLELITREPPRPRNVRLLLKHWPQAGLGPDDSERLYGYFRSLEQRLLSDQ